MRNIEASANRLRGVHSSYVNGRRLAVFSLVLLAAGEIAEGQKVPKPPPPEVLTKETTTAVPRGVPLTPEKRQEIVEKVLAHPDLTG